MPVVNDPWKQFYDTLGDINQTLDTTYARNRQAPIDKQNYDLNQLKINALQTQAGKQKQLDDYLSTLKGQTKEMPNPVLDYGPVQGGAPDMVKTPLSQYEIANKAKGKALELGMADQYKNYQDITSTLQEDKKKLFAETVNRLIVTGPEATKRWVASMGGDPSSVDSMDVKPNSEVSQKLSNGQELVAIRKPDGTYDFKLSTAQKTDEWSPPYTDTVGGKEVQLQKNLATGQVRQIATGATGVSKELPDDQIHELALALLEGSAPGNLREIFSVRSNNIAKTILEVNKIAKQREQSGRYTDLALKWEAAKKKTQTLNSPNITRLTAAAESLTEGQKLADGTKAPAILDQLVELRGKIPDYKIAQFNNWANFASAQINDPDVRAYRALVLSAADKIATINSGGGSVTSDFKDRQAQAIFSMGLNKAALKAVVDVQRKELQTQTASFVNSTPLNINYQQQINPGAGGIQRVNSIDDYNKLPAGATYVDPNGIQRTKGAQ